MITDKKEINIAYSFRNLGILKSDTVMIHGDAGVAAQLVNIEPSLRINELIRQIIGYFSPEGTVVVPTFSYSFTKNEYFDRVNTPSQVGLFSESFRKYSNVRRSNHPIFSVAGIGKNFEKFEKSEINDCFGANTAFDLLYKLGGKIICLGCDFHSGATFVHYIEQRLGVSYRYMKNFSGFIVNDAKKYPLKTSYYVRKLGTNSILDFSFLKKELINQGKLLTSNIGRFQLSVISTNDLLNCLTYLFKENKIIFLKD